MKVEAGNSSVEIDFGGGKDEAAPSSAAFARYAKARLDRAEAQQRFLARETKSVADVKDIVDAMVTFDKVRAGRMWSDGEADRLAKSYHGAFETSKQVRLKALPVKGQVAGLRPIIVPPEGLGGLLRDLQRDEHSRVIDPAHTGWYYEKYFNHTGPGHATMNTWQLFTDPTMGGEANSSLRNSGDQDSSQATAETGRWFSYVPERSGYIQGVCLADIGSQLIQGQLRGGQSFAAIQSIDGAVGLLSGDNIIGRLYVQLDKAMYGSGGSMPDNSVNQHIENRPGGFVMHSKAHVEKGERITVIMGIRVKAVAAGGGTSASLKSATRARPTAFSAGILDLLPPS
jgi:hypothetical protein